MGCFDQVGQFALLFHHVSCMKTKESLVLLSHFWILWNQNFQILLVHQNSLMVRKDDSHRSITRNWFYLVMTKPDIISDFTSLRISVHNMFSWKPVSSSGFFGRSSIDAQSFLQGLILHILDDWSWTLLRYEKALNLLAPSHSSSHYLISLGPRTRFLLYQIMLLRVRLHRSTFSKASESRHVVQDQQLRYASQMKRRNKLPTGCNPCGASRTM